MQCMLPMHPYLGACARIVVLDHLLLWLVVLWLALPKPVVVLDTGGLQGAALGGVGGVEGEVASYADAATCAKQWHLRVNKDSSVMKLVGE
jgi:hypothetical protein